MVTRRTLRSSHFSSVRDPLLSRVCPHRLPHRLPYEHHPTLFSSLYSSVFPFFRSHFFVLQIQIYDSLASTVTTSTAHPRPHTPPLLQPFSSLSEPHVPPLVDRSRALKLRFAIHHQPPPLMPPPQPFHTHPQRMCASRFPIVLPPHQSCKSMFFVIFNRFPSPPLQVPRLLL